MGLMQSAAEIWRKYAVDGVPASGPNRPKKAEIIAWGTTLETMLGAGVAGLAYVDLASLSADLAHGANVTAMVYADGVPANNGLYLKVGASGIGSWLRISDLPLAVVPLTVSGGTGNAIVATAPETPSAPGRKLFVLTPSANNSGATSLSYNGQPALPIKSAFGNALVGGELLNASPVLMLGASDHFTLLLSTNVDASGILASAVAAASSASASASAAAASAASFLLSLPFAHGVAGNGTTDDRAAIQATIDDCAAAGGGYVHAAAGKTYRVVIGAGVTDLGLIIKSGVTLILNSATINIECTGTVYGVRLQSNAHIMGPGTVAVTLSSSPGSGGIYHAAIALGATYGEVTSVGALGNYLNASKWSIRNLTVIGGRPGGFAISGVGGISQGVVEDITFPDNANIAVCLGFDWGTVGSISSTPSAIPTSRTNFDAGTAYTVHPNNIRARRLKIGAMTRSGSIPLRLSGVHAVTIEDFEIASSDGFGFQHTAGDLGYEFAPASVKPNRHKGVVIRNGSILNANSGSTILCDAFADNINAAIISPGYSPLLPAIQSTDIVFENIRGVTGAGASAANGIWLHYMEGGTFRNCTVIGHLYGFRIEEFVRRVLIINCEVNGSYNQGIWIGHTSNPDDCVVDGCYIWGNCVGISGAGIHVSLGKRHTITRCRLGIAGETTQDNGIFIDAATVDAVVTHNHVVATVSTANAYLLGSSTGYGCVRLFTDNTFDASGVSAPFAGLNIFPKSYDIGANGAVVRRFSALRASLSGGVTPMAGAWLIGDTVEFSDPVTGGYTGSKCTVSGSPGTWKNYGLLT
jgi:hypothetical protein